jgi:hypothetical protein
MVPRNELASIVDRLSSIQQIFEHLVDAEEKERNRQQVREKVPLEITGTFRLPEAIETKRSTDQKRYHTTQKFIAVAAWAAFFAAAIYAGLAYFQLKEMISATSATYDAVHEARRNRLQAEKSLTATINQFYLDQRAWVVVKEINGVPQLDKPWFLKIFFVNTGKTPARNVKMSCWIDIKKNESLVNFNKMAPDMRPILIAPNDPSTYCSLSPITMPKVTQQVFDELSDPARVFFAHGFVNYDDVSGKNHWLTFCRIMQPDGTIWNGCKTHNDTGDGTYPKEKSQNRN